MTAGEIEHATRPVYVGIECRERAFGVGIERGFRRGMDDERERAFGKLESGDVAPKQPYCGMPGEVRRLLAELLRATSQRDHGNPQIQLVVGPEQTLQQPSSD